MEILLWTRMEILLGKCVGEMRRRAVLRPATDPPLQLLGVLRRSVSYRNVEEQEPLPIKSNTSTETTVA